MAIFTFVNLTVDNFEFYIAQNNLMWVKIILFSMFYTNHKEKMYRNKSTENEKTIFWFGIELVNGNDVEKKLMSFEYACNWNSLSGYVCALVAEWCLNDEISKGKAYNLDEIEGIQKFIESLPGEIKQNIVKL